MQFCSTLLSTCEEEPSCNPRVLVATVAHQENPHPCLQILHAAKFQVLRGAYILLRVLAVTESQEAQGLLEEIRRQPSVFLS